MDINYPKGFVRSALSISISVALIGCGATPTEVRQGRGANPTLSSAQWQSNLDRARAEFSRGNYGNAIVLLEAELANRPASVAALNGLGACYDQLGRYDVAQRYYYRALDMAPESSTTLSNIGYSYMQEGRNEEAVQILELALERDSDNKTAASNLGMAISKLSESGRASSLVLNDARRDGTSVQRGSSSGGPGASSGGNASLSELIATLERSQQTGNDSEESNLASSDIASSESADAIITSDKNNSTEILQEDFGPEQGGEIQGESQEQLLAENFVQDTQEININPLPSLPSPAALMPGAGISNDNYLTGLSASMTVTQPRNKIAELIPAPPVESAAQSIANVQSQTSAAQSVPSAGIIQEPAAVVIEPEFINEKNSIAALEPFEPLSTALATTNGVASSMPVQQQVLPQPEKRVAAIEPLPSPAIAQQPISSPPPVNQMRDMAPSIPATPLPLPEELAQAPIPAVGEFATPAQMTPPPNIVAAEPPSATPEIMEEPIDNTESLVLTVLDMKNVPELTLRILESQEPTAAEASDFQRPLQEPPAESSYDKELPQLDHEQVADLSGAPMQPPVDPASDVPEPRPELLDNSEPTPQVAIAQTDEIVGAPSAQFPVASPGEGEQSASVMTASYNLAVANGNGVRGIARATSTWLDTEELNITEVVDADNFEYSQTVIRHKPEFAQLAMEMAAQMAVNCDIQVSDDLLDGVDMQLILGQDFASNVEVKDGWLSFGDEEVNQVESELRVEISNGNGVGGMAGRLRNYLQAKGSSIVRLTNADNFGYSESVLFYRPGTRDAAEELLLALPVKDVLLQESSNLADTVDARLLIGRDFVPYDIGPGET